jgi:ssDNA-binding Zn-finger/Zn-ribbon topoisomerase 1
MCGAEHGGKMAQRRSRFGWVLGCDRYPECKYIPKAEVPAEFKLEFDALCPVCGVEHGGKLGPKKNNKRGTYFYSCNRYPDCKTIRPRPSGATHAECGAVIGKDDEGGICTKCGARVTLPEVVVVGSVIAGGEPDPLAWVPKRPRRGAAAAGGDAKATAKSKPKPKAKSKAKAKAKPKAKAKAKSKDPAAEPVAIESVAEAPAEQVETV